MASDKHSGFLKNFKKNKSYSNNSDIILDISAWKFRIEQLGLPDVPLKTIRKKDPICDRDEFYTIFKNIFPKFVIYAAHKEWEGLIKVGLQQNQIDNMKSGIAPENYTMILRVPYEYGGDFDFDNLIFIQTRPFSEMFYDFTREQLVDFDKKMRKKKKNKNLGDTYKNGLIKYYPPKLFIPNPEGLVYKPAFNGSLGGPGGNATSDRLTAEGAAEFLSNMNDRGME